MSHRMRLVAAVMVVSSSVLVPAASPGAAVLAVSPGYLLPIDQSWFNGNYNGSSDPMDYGVCHHGACNSPLQRFWAIDLSGGSVPGASIYAWEPGVIQEKNFQTGWGNYVKFGWQWTYPGSAPATFVNLYAHGDSHVAGTDPGQYVTAGQLVLKMGKTGTGANNYIHLHFDSRVLAYLSVFGNEALTTGTYTAYCTRLFLQQINSNQTVYRQGGFYRPPNTVTNGNCT